jgi:hypothetical protein
MLEFLVFFAVLVVGTVVLGSLFLLALIAKLVLRLFLLPVALLFGLLKFVLFLVLIVLGIAVAPIALIFLFLFGIPILLLMGVVGISSALATG